jgi:hypothetical protein
MGYFCNNPKHPEEAFALPRMPRIKTVLAIFLKHLEGALALEKAHEHNINKNMHLQYISPRVRQPLPPTLFHQNTLQAHDVPVDTLSWQNGVDNVPQDLCDKVQKLMHAEARKFGLSLQVTDTGFALFTTKARREGDTICDVSCLWYSTKENLKQVLSMEGNKALLDKLVAVDGLYKGDAPARFFGIRVGCAAWARHYLGNRKGGPNAKIVIKSQAGFTSGLAQMVVSSRTQLGIGQDTEICLNYGADYDFEVLQEIQESPCKKFKGALAVLFENQEAQKSTKEEPKPKDEDKRKPENDGGPEVKKAKKDEPKKDEPKKEEEPKKDNSEDSAIIAKDVTAEGFTLKFQDGNLSIHAKTNAAAGNKKVVPGTLLHFIRDGMMTKKEAKGGVLYHLDQKTSVMIAPSEKDGPMGLGGKPLTLAQVVDQLKILTIDQFPEFAVAGQLPAKLITSHKYWFTPKDRFFFNLCAHTYYIQ